MSGYFASLVAHAALPGVRLRPVATSYDSPPLDLVEQVKNTAASLAAPPEVMTAVEQAPARRPDAGSQTPSSVAANDPSLPDVVSRANTSSVEKHATGRSLPEAVPTRSRERFVPVRVAPERQRPRAATIPDSASTAAIAPSAIDVSTSVPPVRWANAPQAPAAAPGRHEGMVATAPAEPDVHIHIGRIELTAVTMPARERRPVGGGRKALALDDYLQRRNRKLR